VRFKEVRLSGSTARNGREPFDAEGTAATATHRVEDERTRQIGVGRATSSGARASSLQLGTATN
jgi:hypothetical protein